MAEEQCSLTACPLFHRGNRDVATGGDGDDRNFSPRDYPELLSFVERYERINVERYQRYVDEEFTQPSGVSKEGHERFQHDLEQLGVKAEVQTVFMDTYYSFIQFWAARKAIQETSRDITFVFSTFS